MPMRDYPPWDPTIVASVKASFDTIRGLLKLYKTNLTPEEKKKLFKQGVGREAFVFDVTTTAHNFPNSIPGDCDVNKLDNVNDIKYAIDEIITNASDLFESLNDTSMLAGVQGLDICNDIYKYFKITAKSNAPLNDKVKELGKIYSKNGKRKPGSNLAVPAAASILLGGLKKKSRVVNLGTTVLVAKCADNELQGKVKFADAKIEPGGSFLLPDGYTSVIIVNSDTLIAGTISIKLK